MNSKTIAFIGGGNMASSLMRGLLASGHPANRIWVSDPAPDALAAHRSQLLVNVTSDNLEAVQSADVVVFSVKPQVLGEVAQSLAASLSGSKKLLISIAAGINQSSLSHWLGRDQAIVRCMPNTPALVLTGATALHANAKVNAEQKDLAENILRAVGLSLWVEDESLLDAVTAVSGSGPAYFFLLMEAMEQAAIDMGLDEASARLLTQQTALGAAKIAMESSESPAQLRARVTSPGGTTQKAIETFQSHHFEQIVNKALLAARDRSIELSKQLGAQ
jgi:pyrroline-5-carboxylate reductase